MATTPRLHRTLRLLQASLCGVFAASALWALPAHADLALGNNPLYLVAAKANVLMMLDNSNSMDEAPSGVAVGSDSAASKSEIARGVIKTLTDTYRNRVNMGLMSYRLNTPASFALHSSPYDASFDPATYDATWTGSRSSSTHKRFRVPNLTSPSNYVYYNVALPFYASSSYGNAFCYSPTANAAGDFRNGEDPLAGPWDNYRCFQTKIGTSNALPIWGDSVSEAAAGYINYWFSSSFYPTDSDYAQAITDFGRFLTWTYVGPTWFSNDSPGRGYLHVPLADLGTSQAYALKSKLACNVPGNPAACTSAGIQNAGLTPIQGTLLTALDYYNGTLSSASEGYTSSCYPLPQSCGKNFVVLLTDGLPSTDKDGNVVSNPATALAAAAAAAAQLKAAGIETYIIGFALPYGTDPTTLNQIAVAGGTVQAYSASDPVSLQAAFDAIFTDIFKKSSAFGSVSQNSTAINTGSLVFQGRFDSTDWSGEVLAIKPSPNGNLTEIWNTSDSSHIPAAASRKIYTYTGSAGVEFKTLGSLTSGQQTALTSPDCSTTLTGNACGQARIDWIRGDRSQEDSSGPLRRRGKVFGDVISSSPYYVTSTDTLFVGSNDGMLHAINATTGDERFTYVPNAIFSKLYKLTVSGYSHDYFVDGEIAVSTDFETPGKNILVGSLGRGAKALYALDVTNPGSFGASKVKWEFTDPDLGLVLGRPVIANLNNGVAAVIVGNGYNSTNQRAFLFVINLETGALIRKIDTGAGSASANNGMATPRGWDLDGDGAVDIVYAGDLLGNVWKLDLSSSTPSLWGVAITNASLPGPLFVAKDSLGNTQPITGMIGVGMDAKKGDTNFGKRFIFFGTGRYLTPSDVTNTQAQSWYGLIDDDTLITGRTQLRQRSIAVETVISGNDVRAFSLATAGDMAGKRGWYLDLVPVSTVNGGERMIGEHKFFGTVLLASSLIPSTDVCVPGGSGFVNAIDPFTGAALTNLFFDANNDLSFNDSDRVGPDNAKRGVGSISPGLNLPSDAILIGNRLVVSGTSGQTRSLSVNNPIRNGRIAWREVVNK